MKVSLEHIEDTMNYLIPQKLKPVKASAIIPGTEAYYYEIQGLYYDPYDAFNVLDGYLHGVQVKGVDA